MAVVHHDHRVMLVGQGANVGQRCERAVHREDAIGRDQAEPGVLRFLQAARQIGDVAILVAPPLGLAEPNAVDDAGVIKFVADDRVVLAEDGLEEPAVGVPAGAVKDGVVFAEKLRDGLFEVAMDILGAANEANRGHAVAEAFQTIGGGGDDVGMIRQAEIIVRAEVDDLAVADLDGGTLRPLKLPFALVKPLGFQIVELGPQLIAQAFLAHG